MECKTKDELIRVLDALLDQKEILRNMNQEILRLHGQKVYSGGYEVVKLLTKGLKGLRKSFVNL